MQNRRAGVPKARCAEEEAGRGAGEAEWGSRAGKVDVNGSECQAEALGLDAEDSRQPLKA
jgi:hypothetical protein